MKSNLVLIGFMGSGKSTVGRILAKMMEMKFIDSDYEIERNNKMTIPEIFEKYGHDEFRKIEIETVHQISKRFRNTVISTGGGIILNSVNIENLRKDSMIVYLNADRKVLYQRLKNSRNRPLLDKDNLWDNINKTMDFREELYKKSCDYEVDIAWENAYEVAEKIKKLYIEKG